MQVWSGLLYKEWKLSRKSFWNHLAVTFVFMLTGIGAAHYWNEPNIVVGVGILLIFLHLFYVAADMFISLNREAKSMLWLHNPNAVFFLLWSKMSVAIFTCLLSLLYTISLLLLVIVWLQIPYDIDSVIEGIFIFLPGLFLTSIYLGVWLTLFWVLFKISKGWVVKILTVGLLLPVVHLHLLFYETSLYEWLLAIWKIPYYTVGTAFENEVFTFGVEIGEFSVALLGFYCLVSILIMALSARFIDKKMEM